MCLPKTHFHVWLMADNRGRRTPPTVMYRQCRGYRSRTAAYNAARRMEIEPRYRQVLPCDNPHCKMVGDDG